MAQASNNMPNKLEIKPGDRYGRLVILKEVEQVKTKRWFLCKCDCGTQKHIRIDAFKRNTQSCGCLTKEVASIRSTRHGMHNTSIYNVWHSMKQRCYNANDHNYKHYGQRGITMYSEWLDAKLFINWALSNGYKENLTIERIDNNKGYSPLNCKWATQLDQLRNTRRTVKLTLNNVTMCRKDWATKIGISSTSLKRRLEKLPLIDALTTPPNKKKQHYAIINIGV